MSEKLTKESFKAKIFDWEKSQDWKFSGDKPAIIDFYAEWCGPCKMLGPVLEEVSKKYAGKLDVYKVDTDAEPELSAMFQIQSVPTLFFVPKDGAPQYALGALPKGQIEKAVSEILKVE
jgi:thioredoxin